MVVIDGQRSVHVNHINSCWCTLKYWEFMKWYRISQQEQKKKQAMKPWAAGFNEWEPRTTTLISWRFQYCDEHHPTNLKTVMARPTGAIRMRNYLNEEHEHQNQLASRRTSDVRLVDTFIIPHRCSWWDCALSMLTIVRYQVSHDDKICGKMSFSWTHSTQLLILGISIMIANLHDSDYACPKVVAVD